MRRPLAFAAVTAAATVLVAFPAAAHVSVTPSDAVAGGYATLAFSVPHGCDGESTNTIEVAIPAGVVSVKPEFVAGWDATTEIGSYDEPVELHGEEITEGAVAVTWTAQDDAAALPDDQFRTFGITMKLPDAEAGTELPFPTVQGCVDGSETAWITVPEGDEEVDHPAPVLTITAAEGGHGHGDDATESEDGEDMEAAAVAADADDAEVADADVEAAASTDGADDGTDPLTIVALVVGVLGLAAGLLGWSTARRQG